MTVVAVGLILLAAADVLATAFLVRKAREVREPALQERAIASVVLTVVALLAALLSAVYLAEVTLPPPTGTIVLTAALTLVSAPQLIWVASYATGRFR